MPTVRTQIKTQSTYYALRGDKVVTIETPKFLLPLIEERNRNGWHIEIEALLFEMDASINFGDVEGETDEEIAEELLPFFTTADSSDARLHEHIIFNREHFGEDITKLDEEIPF